MFVCSFKLNKTRLLSGVAAICLTLTLVFLMLPDPSDTTAAGQEKSAKNQQEMVLYLDSVGYTVTPEALAIEQVSIPETFDQKYEEYNEMQKPAGFDLKKYAGKTLQKYTFKVLNYQDAKIEVVANLLIYDDKIVGGDVSSTDIGGFCKGLITDKSE